LAIRKVLILFLTEINIQMLIVSSAVCHSVARRRVRHC